MNDLVLTTFDWVPDGPKGYVRDLRVRWALEEAGLPYRVESMPCRDRGPEHFIRQPFGQVPWLTNGSISLFETGAILLYLGERSDVLLPSDPVARSKVLQWTFAALNSVEKASHPLVAAYFSDVVIGDTATEFFGHALHSRLRQLEPVLPADDWLAGRFSIADILMADVLRLIDRVVGLSN